MEETVRKIKDIDREQAERKKERAIAATIIAQDVFNKRPKKTIRKIWGRADRYGVVGSNRTPQFQPTKKSRDWEKERSRKAMAKKSRKQNKGGKR